MAETCIVCLGDLCQDLSPDNSHLPFGGETNQRSASDLDILTAKAGDGPENIAHLLPCQHDLHDSCLKPWVERANSCPICRAVFNEVEVKAFVNGPVLDTYAVQDKRQEADIDPGLVVEDDLLEDNDPCLVCSIFDDATSTMYCDGCDRAIHVFCAGCQEAPEVYYCAACMSILENDGTLPLAHQTTAPIGRARTRSNMRSPRRSRSGRARRPNSDWARVWQTVWNNLNLDLDFPFDNEEPTSTRRTPSQMREFGEWQRRLRVATRQGAAERFRETAPVLLSRAALQPESQEELRAWNAFDKARDIQSDDGNESIIINRRKRKATSASPAPSREQDQISSARSLKRPRTRRNKAIDNHAQAESSTQAASRRDGPGFFTSLLQEVENRGAISDVNSTSTPTTESLSPAPYSSPETSPVIAPRDGSLRAFSVTPPPLISPTLTPLSSAVRPPLSPPLRIISPSTTPKPISHSRQIGHQTLAEVMPSTNRRTSTSNGRHLESSLVSLSYPIKSEIQRMVKNVLGSRYRNREINTEEYTDINRSVSRRLYEHVIDADDLADEDSRNRLQQLARNEVERAIQALAR